MLGSDRLYFVLREEKIVQATILAQANPPAPFLGPIYYGQRTIYNIFDHNLPCANVCVDNNDNVWHYNGTVYEAVTITPDPAGTPTPTGWPSPAPYIPINGYGYDEHAGIDYGLEYELILAAASGTVLVRDWHHPSNHRLGFGLYVQLDHGTYTTLYAHLSVVTVNLFDSVSVNPSSREGIIGISGNTGAVFGCGDIGVEEDPTCGAHLHFETREGAGYRPVNPYGWISTPVIDPWPSVIPYGAVSYPLWATRPAIAGTPQYPSGPSVPEPPAPPGVRIINDEDPEFYEYPPGCMATTTAGGYSGGFHYMEVAPLTPTAVPTAVNCNGPVLWFIEPNESTPPGTYDVYVYIPEPPTGETLSRGVRYEIHSNAYSEHTTVIVVQAAYPNEAHEDRWVYIGRHYFTMNGINEAIVLHWHTLHDEGEGFWVAADAIQLALVTPGTPVTPGPTDTPAPPTYTPMPTPTATPVNTGFRGPTTNTAEWGGDNNGYEVSPVNAYLNDAGFAGDNLSGTGGGISLCSGSGYDKHRFYNYGFTLPGSPTIVGIEVRVDAKVNTISGSPRICMQLSWDGGATWTGGKFTSVLNTTERSFILGGTSDTWGRTWSSSDFSNSNFRVRVIDSTSVNYTNFSLDWVAVKVYYYP